MLPEKVRNVYEQRYLNRHSTGPRRRYENNPDRPHFLLASGRYNVEEEGGCDDLDQGDNGWKIIHTDVFRFPPYKSLLCAVLGVGAQFLTLATGERSPPSRAVEIPKRCR